MVFQAMGTQTPTVGRCSDDTKGTTFTCEYIHVNGVLLWSNYLVYASDLMHGKGRVIGMCIVMNNGKEIGL